jgi:hypothetical protein
VQQSGDGTPAQRNGGAGNRVLLHIIAFVFLNLGFSFMAFTVPAASLRHVRHICTAPASANAYLHKVELFNRGARAYYLSAGKRRGSAIGIRGSAIGIRLA